MSFIPRHPTIQESQLQHDPNSGVAAAGSVVYLSGDGQVARVTQSGHAPMGFLGSDVVAENANVPKGYQWPGQMGSSAQFVGDPVMVAYGDGSYDTTQYKASGSGISAGVLLYAVADGSDDSGKLVDSNAGTVALEGGVAKPCARSLTELSADEVTAGKALLIKSLL